MRLIKIFFILNIVLTVSCNSADIARLFKNVNLEKKGIHIKLTKIPQGLHQKPFMISFDQLLSSISEGKVITFSYNIFTVGDDEKLSKESILSVTNFLDPTSKFKDAWFGIYIIVDDEYTAGKKFILKNPFAKPDDIDNLKDESLLLLPELDQKILVWSSHQHQKNYTWKDLQKDFYFTPVKGTIKKEVINDRYGRSWHSISGSFDTIAAITDTAKTDMGLFSSFRAYVGLPNEKVYSHVAPWHPIVIKGKIFARYFQCGEIAFWAVVYYNGTSFTEKDGRHIDTWKNTDIQSVFVEMFDGLEIGCAKKY